MRDHVRREESRRASGERESLKALGWSHAARSPGALNEFLIRYV